MGQGAYADVFLVQHNGTGTRLALKRVAKSQLHDSADVRQALAERDIMGALSHPFIVQLRAAFQTRKCLYYAMDFAAGGELFSLLRRAGPLPEDAVRLYAAEAVLALSHLHARGILHSDVKLENILLDADGHTRLTDFGLSQTHTALYSVAGTREYMSPEALRGEPPSKAVDFWALVR